MSHISKIELEVNDIAALRQACSALGLVFQPDQRTFKWFGESAQCEHAIKVPDARYEIGVVKAHGRYELNCDYYDPGIENVIGRQGGLLKQAYAVARTKTEARRKGYTVIEKKTDAGIRLHLRMG